MSYTAQASLTTFIDGIRRIERGTEAIYLKLGALFPVMKAGVDQSAASAEAAIRAIMQSYRAGTSRELAARRATEFVEDAGAFFAKVSAAEAAFLSGIDDSIEHLGRLDDIIDRIRDDSEEMEIVSLNAMTVALKSGAAGRAFSVITDELKRLSARTIVQANELSSSGAVLMQELATLRITLSELGDRQAAFFDGVKEALEHGLKELDAGVDASAEWLRGMAADAQAVRGPVSDIMQSVQVQDIIRQSLDHVLLSLGAAEEASSSASGEDEGIDEELFLGEITRLSAALLDDVHGQVDGSLGRFRLDFDRIRLIMRELDEKRLLSPARTARRFDESDFDDLVASYLKAKEEAGQRSARIVQSVQQLSERFKAVNAILGRFRNIVTASRIEIARNKALAIVANTVRGMMDLTERLAKDIDAAGEVTRGFSKALTAGVGEYLNGAEASAGELERELGRLKGEFRRIEASRQALCDAEDGFEPFSAGFVESIGAATAQAERIAAICDELRVMRDELERRSADIRERFGLEGLGADSIHNRRLKEIVDRFTIYAHKQAASRIAGLGNGAEELVAAESGEVTLF